MSQRIKLSRQWVGLGSPRPKKFKAQPSAGKVMATVFWDAKGFIMLDFLPKRSTITGVYYAGKVMATVFWDAKGIIMLDFLPKRSTITGVYYANLLDQLRTAISQGKLSKGVLLH